MLLHAACAWVRNFVDIVNSVIGNFGENFDDLHDGRLVFFSWCTSKLGTIAWLLSGELHLLYCIMTPLSRMN